MRSALSVPRRRRASRNHFGLRAVQPEPAHGPVRGRCSHAILDNRGLDRISAWTFRGTGDRMKRILLFVATNVAVLLVLAVVLQVLGIESLLAEQGTELDLRALLICSAVVGFTGSFISLAMSKWSAKRLTGAQVIESPRNETERWLLSTVQRQAREAGIACPEVAI